MDAAARDRLLRLAMQEFKEAFYRYAAQIIADDLLKSVDHGTLALHARVASLGKVAHGTRSQKAVVAPAASASISSSVRIGATVGAAAGGVNVSRGRPSGDL